VVIVMLNSHGHKFPLDLSPILYLLYICMTPYIDTYSLFSLILGERSSNSAISTAQDSLSDWL
jgi:hypothetical protein